MSIDLEDSDHQLVDGSGNNIVPALKDFLAVESDKEKLSILDENIASITHAGTFFPAAAVAFPVFVSGVIGLEDKAARLEAMIGLGAVLTCPNKSIPESLKPDFESAERMLVSAIKESVRPGISEQHLFHALVVLAGSCNHYRLAQAIEQTDYEEWSA